MDLAVLNRIAMMVLLTTTALSLLHVWWMIVWTLHYYVGALRTVDINLCGDGQRRRFWIVFILRQTLTSSPLTCRNACGLFAQLVSEWKETTWERRKTERESKSEREAEGFNAVWHLMGLNSFLPLVPSWINFTNKIKTCPLICTAVWLHVCFSWI